MVSPWFLAMGASMMSHSLTLLLVLSAWLLMLTDGPRRPLAWFVGGGLLGWLFLTRPLEGVTIGILTGLWAMTRVNLKAVSGWAMLAAFGAGCALVGSLIFPYNHALTGDALLTPITQTFDLLWHPGANRLGFAADIGSPDHWGGVDVWLGHSPLEALVQAQYNLKAINVELLGWSIGSLVPLYVHLLWGRISRADWCMLAVIGVTIATYALYWFNGGFYIGPRYWFMALFPALFLSARGLQTAAGLLGRANVSHGRETVAALVMLLAVTAMVAFLPWRATGRYWGFRGAHSGYRDLAANGALGNALVFIKTNNVADYANAFALNSPDLTGPIFLRDLGPDDERPDHCPLSGTACPADTGREHSRLQQERVMTGAAKQKSHARPLVVDLDGTLVPVDLLVEQFAAVASNDWRGALYALGKLRHGKSALKAAVAEHSELKPNLLPYDPEVLALVRKAREEGRPVYLATASHDRHAQAIAEHLGLFDGVFATTPDVNLVGEAKAKLLVDRFGEGGYDYVGNHAHDLSVWKHAHTAYAVRASANVRQKLRRLGFKSKSSTAARPAYANGSARSGFISTPRIC